MTEVEKFIEYLEKDGVLFHRENPNYRPGEGYGPPRFLVVDIKRQIRLFNELDNKNKQQK